MHSHFLIRKVLSGLLILSAQTSQTIDQQEPTLIERVHAAGKVYVDAKPMSLAPATFETAEVGTAEKAAGIYFTLGKVQHLVGKHEDGDVLMELIRYQVWIESSRQSLAKWLPEEGFWKGAVRAAQDHLDSLITDDAEETSSEERVQAIQDEMNPLMEGIRRSVREYATSVGKQAFPSPTRGLASDEYTIKLVTVPDGASIAYLELAGALEQMARRDATHPHGRKFPDQLSFRPVSTDTVKLGGPYIFRIAWPDKTTYEPVNVDSGQERKFKRDNP